MNHLQRAESIKFSRDKLLASTIPALKEFVDSLPTQKLNKILNSSAYQLAAMLNKGETTSVEIVKVFSYRAGTIGKEHNSITDDNFKQAIQTAAKCDELRKQKGWKNGTIDSNNQQEFQPLFGIPLSVKDGIDIKGFASTLGCLQKYSTKCQNDGKIISVLKAGGLIPFVKSNMPQLGMAYESTNIMFGAVMNPWNKSRIAGGSTGGEAALLASRSSILGIGSDVGGSLRNPAQFCGICSLKPNSQRLMLLGHASFAPSINGQTNVKCAMGPMARHVDDLACFMKIVGDQKNYEKGMSDPYKKIIPFDFKMYQNLSQKPQKLRIGYFDSLQIFPTSAASKRAVDEVVSILQAQGHTMVPVKIPGIQDIINVMVSSVCAEGGLRGYFELLNGQPMIDLYSLQRITSKIPTFLSWLLSKVIAKFKPRLGMILSFARQQSSYQYLRLSDKTQIVKRAFVSMWRQDELDFIICPGFAIQAATIGATNELGCLPALYNFMWNVLDVPAGALPVTLCRQDQQKYESPYNDPFHTTAARVQSQAKGLPVGIQVVALPFEEEKVLGLMKYIESKVKFTEKHPYPV